MNLCEYQSKEIFRKYGIPILDGEVATTVEETFTIAEKIGKPVVVKAQVPAGGRGKAGGIKIANTPDGAKKSARKILEMRIKGFKVNKILITKAVDIDRERYLGIIVDREKKVPVVMVSAKGGVDIEEVAKKMPSEIHKLMVDPQIGLLPHQARELCFKICKNPQIAIKTSSILLNLYKAFAESDASLAEINPLAVTTDEQLWALDAKMVIDDSGLFKHPEIEAMRDVMPDEAKEIEAKTHGLSYIKLDGNIGCIVNGAGLAMATMDLIKRCGGEPANFLDIGGSSSPKKVAAAVKFLISDDSVDSIFFNIFGGITRCDDVAIGIVDALSGMKTDVPITIRLTGTREEEAKRILKKVKLIPISSMLDGAKRAIELSGKVKSVDAIK